MRKDWNPAKELKVSRRRLLGGALAAGAGALTTTSLTSGAVARALRPASCGCGASPVPMAALLSLQ